MSLTVLGALRYPIDALLRTISPKGRPNDDRSPAADPSGFLRTDGGDRRTRDDEHLRDLPDGAGCTEIWEHISERKAAEAEADD